MSHRQVKTGNEAREALLDGVNAVGDAVASTIGPKGRDVIIDNRGDMPPTITNDGVTIANEISFSDPWKNLGAKIVKSAASKTNDDAGDGTSTCVVLTREIARKGNRMVATGANPILLKAGIMRGAARVVEILRNHAKKIEGGESSVKILNDIARISGQDEAVGRVIADVFDKVGADSVVTIEDSPKPGIESEMTEGVTFPAGWLIPQFCTNQRALLAEMEKPLIMVSAVGMTSNNDITPWIKECIEAGKKDFVVVAPEFGGAALQTMVTNHFAGSVKVILIKAPYVGDRQKDVLGDFAAIVGAKLIDPAVGKTYANATMADLGSADRIVSERDRTIVLGGRGADKVGERIDMIRGLLDLEKSEWKTEQLKERIANLGAGIAVIRVGGHTEIEQKELRYKVEDAINATRSAIQEGYLPGGGVALAHAAFALTPESTDKDEAEGEKIVFDACFAPITQIAENAGRSPGVVIDRVQALEFWSGWNAATDVFGEMDEMGVIDPTKVECSAIMNAASAASTLLVAETAVIFEPEKTEKGAN